MECFNSFWSRRLQEGAEYTTSPWILGGLDKSIIQPAKKTIEAPSPSPTVGCRYEDRHFNFLNDILFHDSNDDIMAEKDLRAIIKEKALKHRTYYQSLVDTSNAEPVAASTIECQMAPHVPSKGERLTDENENERECELSMAARSSCSGNPKGSPSNIATRYRKRGVFELDIVTTTTVVDSDAATISSTEFRSVKELREKYQAMLDKTQKHLSTTMVKVVNDDVDDDDNSREKNELLLPPSSGYCSSSASGGGSDDERAGAGEKGCWFHKQAVLRRRASSDSAVHSDDEQLQVVVASNQGEKKENITATGEGFLTKSPYSPRGSIDHSNVPSRTIIESKFVPLPLDRKSSIDVATCSDITSSEDLVHLDCESRRESCFSEGDDPNQQPRYRYWRTPSVVVSDYSDVDVMGLTLEDIEYIRNKRGGEHSSAESSLHSSCSNLNYCGSSISGIESDYVLFKPYRKSSNCSTCSTLSDDEDPSPSQQQNHQQFLDNLSSAEITTTLQPLRNREPSGWRKLRNIVQWTPFFQTYKKQRYPWVQLAGHQGNFKAGPDQGTILKKLCAKEEKCFKVLMKDVLRPYVPEYKGLIASDDGECSYIQLQDLLGDFVSPCVMDCKIGVRTYLEEELAKAKEKPKLRKDMYEKMCQIDQNAPTEEEHRLKGVTKPRYMVWRETISSTATLGFRIEGIRSADGTSSKDFKTTKSKEQVMAAFEKFTDSFPHAIPKYIQRLKAIKATLETSSFFNSHEVIGSSLLFVHDRYNANVWLIDFAKTIVLPEDVKITHNSKWMVGNHEDGYLIGVNNLIKIFMTMLEQQPVAITSPLSLQDPPEITKQEIEEKT